MIKGKMGTVQAGRQTEEDAGKRRKDRTEPIRKSGSGKRRTLRIYVAAAAVMTALAAAGAALYYLWSRGVFLPRWILWQERIFSDNTGTYEIRLAGKKAEVRTDKGIIWTSGEGILVQDILSRDVDNDGEEELVLLCWRRGRYGSARPFWVEKNDESWSQHLFVYEYNGGKIHGKWMSSYIGTDVADLTVSEKSGYVSLLFTDTKGHVSCWRWDSWGFTKQETEVSFVVFGDNLIHEPLYRYGLHNGGNFDFLFENIRDMIEESDVAVINQETPLTDDPAMYGDYPRFGTPAQVGEAIVKAGFDAVTCATNHMLDRGEEGAVFTRDFFTSRDVYCLGIRTEGGEENDHADESEKKVSYEIIRRNNIRFALLNYTYGTNGLGLPEGASCGISLLENEARVREEIAEAEAEADVVMIFVHWGTEYSVEIDDFQKKWSRIFLDSGADVVVGAHPHVLQPFEILRDDKGHEMLVYYSIGNFISSQKETFCIKGGAAVFTIALTPEGYRVTEYGLEPLGIVRDSEGKYRAGRIDLPR